MKKQLAEDMEQFIAPWRAKISDILANDALLARTAAMGAEKARASAAATLSEVRNVIGFRKFY
jgi:tryptophanyl-tRNA synthetase